LRSRAEGILPHVMGIMYRY